MHLAAQYLAAANINFVTKEADDSHTNLGFNIDCQRLETHALSPEGDQLALNYRAFSLEWISPKEVISFSLEGKTHLQVLEWLEQTTLTFLNKTYAYEFHYDLPYAIDRTYLFHISDTGALEELARLRTLTENSLERILEENNLEASIRVWPHHFDTGIYTALTGTPDLMIGLGLAIPDTVSDRHYFYASAYKHGDQIDTSSFHPLTTGEWISDSFQGGILSTENSNKTVLVGFYHETLNQFKS